MVAVGGRRRKTDERMMVQKSATPKLNGATLLCVFVIACCCATRNTPRMNTEIVWKVSPTWPGYEASSDGRVRRYNGGVEIKQTLHSSGYRVVNILAKRCQRDIWGNGKGVKRIGVHRVVMDAFVGPVPDGQEVNHIDHDKVNNRPENLEYVTHAENIQKAVAAGRWPRQRDPNWVSPIKGRPCSESHRNKMALAKMGAKHPRAVTPDVEMIRFLWKEGLPDGLIAITLGMSRTTVGDVVRGRHWSVRSEYKRRNEYAPVGAK